MCVMSVKPILILLVRNKKMKVIVFLPSLNGFRPSLFAVGMSEFCLLFLLLFFFLNGTLSLK